jgi:hypothetical protein
MQDDDVDVDDDDEYVVKSTNYEALRYTIFPALLGSKYSFPYAVIKHPESMFVP